MGDLKKGVYKLKSIEYLHVFQAFALTNVFCRNLKLIRYTDHDPTFGRTVVTDLFNYAMPIIKSDFRADTLVNITYVDEIPPIIFWPKKKGGK